MDLPSHFRTWVEFYDNVKTLPEFETLETVVVYEPDTEKAHLTEPYLHIKTEDMLQTHYTMREIMVNALNEILAERFKKDEVIYLTNFIEKEIGIFTSENPLAEEVRRAKRILLTTALK